MSFPELWHMAWTETLMDYQAHEETGKDWSVSQLKTAWNMASRFLLITRQLLAMCQEREPDVKVDFDGLTLRLQDLIRDRVLGEMDQTVWNEVLAAIRAGGVHLHTYDVRVCPHLPTACREEHALWMKGGDDPATPAAPAAPPPDGAGSP